MKYIYLLLILFLSYSFVNAQTWSAVGGPADSIYAEVDAMAVYNNQLYLGGDIQYAAGMPVNNVISWNGTSWNDCAGGIRQTSFTEYVNINCAITFNNELYVAGIFDSVNGQYAPGLAKWNGSNWMPLDTSVRGYHALAVYNNELYVGGSFKDSLGHTRFGVVKWTGSSWQKIGTIADSVGTVAGMAVYDNKLIVAGIFSAIGNNHTACANIAAWDGTSWSPLAQGIIPTGQTIVYTLCAANGKLYAGGHFAEAGSVFARNIAAWDGTSWSNLSAGLGDNSDTVFVNTILPYNGRIIAGGYFVYTGNAQPVNSIAAWDGQQWNAMGLGVYAGQDGVGYVFSLCQWNNSLYAGGYFLTAGNANAFGIAQWTEPAGVDYIPAEKPQVLPNPVNNNLIIENITAGSLLNVTNMLGQSVLKITTTSNKQVIDVSTLSPGMYFVNGAKFIKQ